MAIFIVKYTHCLYEALNLSLYLLHICYFIKLGTCQQNGNFTPSNPDCGMTSQRDFETGDLLFLNDSSPMNQTESLKEVEELLPDIINTENLTDYNITEMALNDGLRSMHMLDEESSESGVSMGSSGSPVHVNI